jgi:hypothetical protein
LSDYFGIHHRTTPFVEHGVEACTLHHSCTLHTFAIDPLQLRETHMQLREIHIAPGEDVANASDQKGTGNVEEGTWFLF